MTNLRPPFDMMNKYGVTYRTAGENIAGNGSVSSAHQALVNSAGHRGNILKSGFAHVGTGAVSGGRYGMMFTQMSVTRRPSQVTRTAAVVQQVESLFVGQ